MAFWFSFAEIDDHQSQRYEYEIDSEMWVCSPWTKRADTCSFEVIRWKNAAIFMMQLLIGTFEKAQIW